MNRVKQGVLAVAVAALAATPAAGQVIVYNNIPGTLDGNYDSQPYQAQQTAEFGNLLHLSAGGTLSSVSLVLSDWAVQSDWFSSGYTDPTGFMHDLTLNIYSVSGADGVGPLLGTKTQSTKIQWRPEADPGLGPTECGAGSTRWYSAADATCYNGYSFKVSFDMSSLNLNLPGDIIVGLAFNTESWGAHPTGVDGPYDSLNFSVGPSVTTVGSDDPDVAYINRDKTPGFERETGWVDERPMITVTATPEPASLMLMGTGLLAVVGFARRRRNT